MMKQKLQRLEIIMDWIQIKHISPNATAFGKRSLKWYLLDNDLEFDLR